LTRSSLRLRLLFAWAVFIVLTLGVAGVGLRFIFERSILHRTEEELEADLRQLRRGMDVTPDGAVKILRAPTDPQFDIPLGGRYWQISEGSSTVLRSQSLRDATLTLPNGFLARDTSQTTWLPGPNNQRLVAVVRNQGIPKSATQPVRVLTIVTAVDAAEIEEDTNKFAADLFKGLAALAGLFLLGAWAHVTVGLRPLEAIRSRVAAVREGKAQNIEGNYPDEIMPLVTETNALLDEQDKALQTARARAGDLAHGLNTPLAVMSAKSRILRRNGQQEIADEIDKQVEAMRRHVERELARARARGAIRTRQTTVDAVRLSHDIVTAIRSLPRQTPVELAVTSPDELFVNVDADDFNNVLGNLLENAHKWARSRINVSIQRRGAVVCIDVDDDGPGIPEADVNRVLLRGERADTSVSGSGLGLAIVSDLVETYRGTLQLLRSNLGGLRASVVLPE
jgi:signal transduction histidine kinase